MAGAPVSSEADGALAGELVPGAGPTSCVGVTPVRADVARVLQGIRGAFCEDRDINLRRAHRFRLHGAVGGGGEGRAPPAEPQGRGPGRTRQCPRRHFHRSIFPASISASQLAVRRICYKKDKITTQKRGTLRTSQIKKTYWETETMRLHLRVCRVGHRGFWDGTQALPAPGAGRPPAP